MNNGLLVAIAFGILVSQVVAPQPRDAAPPRARAGAAAIRGRVFNAETGVPLAVRS